MSIPRVRSTPDGVAQPPRARIGRRQQLPNLEPALYRQGLGPVAGVDEAGRGACAGPLVVAACILGPRLPASLARLDDSKKLTARMRDQLFDVICDRAVSYAIVRIEVADIDRDGIHHHNIAGMRRAVAELDVEPGFVLTDGYEIEGLPMQSVGVVGGDAACPSIAAASVLAKVTRDRIMVDIDQRHPGYGLAGHKGYGTAAHQQALLERGPSPQHRLSYANVQRAAAAHRLRAEEEEHRR